VEDFSEKATEILQKSLIPAIAVIVIGVGVGMGYSYSKSKQEKQLEVSQNELFVIKKDIDKVTETLSPPEPKPELGKDGKPLPPKPKKEAPKVSNADKEKAYASGLERMNAFINANQGQQSAVEGAVLVSEVTSEYGKYDEGISALKTALNGFDKSNFLYGIAQTELGNLYYKTDKCTEAADAWEQVIAQKAHDYLANDLRLKAGICYEKINQYDRAEDQYRTIVTKSPDSSAARTAKKFLLHIRYVKTKGVQPPTEQKKG